jgi:hypothetical protein
VKSAKVYVEKLAGPVRLSWSSISRVSEETVSGSEEFGTCHSGRLHKSRSL